MMMIRAMKMITTQYDLRNPPKILGRTYQKTCKANDCTILSAKIYIYPYSAWSLVSCSLALDI